jgi:hypothetical protein
LAISSPFSSCVMKAHAVDDPRRVRLHQRLGAVRDDAHRSGRVDDPDPRHAIVERLALEELHGDEGAPVLEPPGIVHVDDVRALHAGRRARLAKEALDDDGGGRQLGREHLDGDALVERDVQRLVHRGHTAAPDFPAHAVLADEDGADRDLRLVLDGCHAWLLGVKRACA